MAINPEAQFPGKIEPSSTEYPYGKAQNISVPGDGTGTPWEAVLVNDLFGFQQALLDAGEIVPTGTPEEVGASQYLDALNILYAGRVRGFLTQAAAIADVTLKEGHVLSIADSNNVLWDIVLASSVTIDTFNFVQCTGVPTLALSRRVIGTKYIEGSASGIGLNLVQQLNAERRDVEMLVQGDSTGIDSNNRWVFLTATELGVIYPAYTVDYHLWNDATDSYDAPVTLSVGSGSFTLNVYNGSFSGSKSSYFEGFRRTAAYDGKQFDLIIQNYGHNHGTGSSLSTLTSFLTETIVQKIAEQPDAEIVLTLQNMDTSFEDFSARQVEATVTVAGLFGLGVLDIRSVFRWKQRTGVIGDWMADSVHPNSVGQQVWASVVVASLKNPSKQVKATVNSLPDSAISLIPNTYLNTWDWADTAPDFWSLSSATLTREATIKETLQWSVKCEGTGGSTGTFKITLTEFLQRRTKGNGATFMARVFVPSTNGTNDASRLDVATDITNVQLGENADAEDEWVWRVIYVDADTLDAASTLVFSIFTGNNTDVVYVDRVMWLDGRLPRDANFIQETSPTYYDPINVVATASNTVTVVGDKITFDSSAEGAPRYEINLYNLVPHEEYTFTWTENATAGSVFVQEQLNNGGSAIVAVALNALTVTFRPISDTASISIRKETAALPFDVDDILITKG